MWTALSVNSPRHATNTIPITTRVCAEIQDFFAITGCGGDGDSALFLFFLEPIAWNSVRRDAGACRKACIHSHLPETSG